MELSWSLYLTILAIILGLIWLHQWMEAWKFPPGPWGLPIVGYLPFLGSYVHETFLQLGEKYGNIFSLILGNTNVVVLNDWAAVKAALVDQAHTFSVRPPLFIFDSTVRNRDIATNHGSIWKAQRNFTIQTLKLVDKERSSRESLIMNSVNNLIIKFECKKGQIIRIEDDFFLPMFNIVWKIVSNKTIEDGDEKGKQLYKIVRELIYGLRSSSPLVFMPYLRHFVPGAFGYWTVVKHHNLLWSYLENEVQEHLCTFKEGECRDFLDAYIEEIQRRRQRNEKLEPPYTIEHLTGTLHNLVLGGTETTSSTLAWIILILSVWPQFQDKIQTELDEVIGRGRAPALEDMPMLPYLEAFTLEIHRYCSIVPLSMFHSSLEDTKVLGHRIPKGCMVIPNIYGVHRDPKCWDKPFQFWPERFLESNDRVKKPAYHIPFSVGARMCLGEPLAKQVIFLFLASILQKLSFNLPLNVPKPSLNPIVGITLIPKPFSVIVSTR